jgi:HlyD family secretion protein
MRKAVIFLIVLIGIGIAAYFIFKKDDSKPDYKTEKVEKGDIQDMVTATGTVNAVVNVMVGTQVSGTVSRLFVDYNSLVKKGQILAKLDATQFASRYSEGEAKYISLLASYARLQAETNKKTSVVGLKMFAGKWKY